MKVAETQIAQALEALQQALGERPEGMAVRLGCSFSAYVRWLRGERVPSGDWLVKMIRLCPDDQTRSRFWAEAEEKPLDSKPEGSNIGGTQETRQDRRYARHGPRIKPPKRE